MAIRESFGINTIMTVFLPGVIVGIALIMASTAPQLPAWVQTYTANSTNYFHGLTEWQQTFGAIAVLTLLGSLVAAINGLLESCVYDRITRVRIDVNRKEYVTHWHEYLGQLGRDKNSYISYIVTLFHFESRMAIATLAIVVAALLHDRQGLVAAAAGLIFALSFLASMHHKELADYRKYMFDRWELFAEAEQAEAKRKQTSESIEETLAGLQDRIGALEQFRDFKLMADMRTVDQEPPSAN